MFFREFWEIFKNIYLVEHLQTAAYVSENWPFIYLYLRRPDDLQSYVLYYVNQAVHLVV